MYWAVQRFGASRLYNFQGVDAKERGKKRCPSPKKRGSCSLFSKSTESHTIVARSFSGRSDISFSLVINPELGCVEQAKRSPSHQFVYNRRRQRQHHRAQLNDPRGQNACTGLTSDAGHEQSGRAILRWLQYRGLGRGLGLSTEGELHKSKVFRGPVVQTPAHLGEAL